MVSIGQLISPCSLPLCLRSCRTQRPQVILHQPQGITRFVGMSQGICRLGSIGRMDPFVGSWVLLKVFISVVGTALQPPLKTPYGCREAAVTLGHRLHSLGLISRLQRGLEEGVSYFRLQIRVEVAIGQILSGKQKDE